MDRQPRVILIGGSSHAGKSTLAKAVAERLGGTWVSTDSLARHPGRPWAAGPDRAAAVAEHYLSLGDDELIASVLAHYRKMAPLIEERVRAHAEGPDTAPLVLEGSALLPETVTTLRVPGVVAVWLVADERLFETRIHAESRYAEADPIGRATIDKFLERTRRFDRLIRQDVARLKLASFMVEEAVSPADLVEACLNPWPPGG